MSDAREAFRSAVLATLGSAPDVIEPGQWQRFATSNKRGDRAGWSKLFADLRGGVFGCHRQGIAETWSAADRAIMTRPQRLELARQVMHATAERQAQQREQWAVSARRNLRIWTECVPLVPGDPVTLYLKARGFAGLWPLPACLRLHRGLPYWHEGQELGAFPAMVAPVVAPDGRIVALHRTYLTRDGRKAEVPTVRKLTGAAGPLAGACIPLFKPTQGGIGIAEGIETALAAHCGSGMPTVASYCAGNLAAWQWPAGLSRLVIFADADPTGRDSADRLWARAVAAGLRADVLAPTDDGADWCDVWATGGRAAA
jgi:phage/plasmid primase-like uncharacterized protein